MGDNSEVSSCRLGFTWYYAYSAYFFTSAGTVKSVRGWVGALVAPAQFPSVNTASYKRDRRDVARNFHRSPGDASNVRRSYRTVTNRGRSNNLSVVRRHTKVRSVDCEKTPRRLRARKNYRAVADWQAKKITDHRREQVKCKF